MQDQNNYCQSHVGRHMDVNCKASSQTVNVCDDLKWTTNTHVTHLHSLLRHN